MAVGLGYMFGLRIPQNFNSPYKALDPADFWRRWHISLSTCMRDYLYIPFGGNRGSTAETYRNLMLTMLIGGLWHGAAWTFVLLRKMFTPSPGLLIPQLPLVVLAIGIAALWAMRGPNAFELKHDWRWPGRLALASAFGVALALIVGNRPSPFLYFQF